MENDFSKAGETGFRCSSVLTIFSYIKPVCLPAILLVGFSKCSRDRSDCFQIGGGNFSSVFGGGCAAGGGSSDGQGTVCEVERFVTISKANRKTRFVISIGCPKNVTLSHLKSPQKLFVSFCVQVGGSFLDEWNVFMGVFLDIR